MRISRWGARVRSTYLKTPSAEGDRQMLPMQQNRMLLTCGTGIRFTSILASPVVASRPCRTGQFRSDTRQVVLGIHADARSDDCLLYDDAHARFQCAQLLQFLRELKSTRRHLCHATQTAHAISVNAQMAVGAAISGL